ncbi:metallophosphoesterase [Nocardioides coralli]|uniref:metallophosphoesterase n=1 Tax=Nocardioides coralli TaxID=2872154 RepID=UPI001CA44B44|nr:metallophosphoesterase [Nocardioides coralli]QZY28727.1 metallophosphoesterase [Nocardioides coralli]
MARKRLLRGLGLAAVWLVVAVATAVTVFLNSEREVVVASHDTVVRPTVGGEVLVRTGPVLPDLRLDTDQRIGVDVTLGKTTAETMGQLVERYAVIAGQPDGSVAKVESAVTDMALDAAGRGAVAGLVPVGIWLLVGHRRRQELWDVVRRRRLLEIGLVLGVVAAGLLVWAPWRQAEPSVRAEQEWLTLAEFLGPDVPLPADLPPVEVRSSAGAIDSRRLVASAVSTYRKANRFYDRAAEEAADLELREPEEGETVAVLVSDRHDNIGMDPVARAIADRAGATVVLNAGDDTSTGQRWEAFSLDSVSAAFEGLQRFAVAGNHDHGDFVRDYLGDRGWTMLDGTVVEGPGGGTLIGLDDPRSSGLGDWRDETGLSFSEVAERFSEEICAADERVNTVLVHDTNQARSALEQGCADLVIGGHVHVKIGPEAVTGPDGETGYAFTTGTTGGAAYAIAIGSKPRRDAMVTLITYDAEGRPIGLQPVTLQTNGTFLVEPWQPLTYPTDETDDTGPTDEPDELDPTEDPDQAEAEGEPADEAGGGMVLELTP